jgi:hypothetical protein
MWKQEQPHISYVSVRIQLNYDFHGLEKHFMQHQETVVQDTIPCMRHGATGKKKYRTRHSISENGPGNVSLCLHPTHVHSFTFFSRLVM